MNLVFSDHLIPSVVCKSIFLAGPSPRNHEQKDWRAEAVAYLKETGFAGTVFLPCHQSIFEGSGTSTFNYDDQIAWERQARHVADIILFWVPRVVDMSRDDLGMPGFTTNFELGEDYSSGKIVYGRPETAVKCRYLDSCVTENGHPVHITLSATLDAAVTLLGEGAARTGGEATVPLFIWNTPQFQSWYADLLLAGNTLESVKVLHHFRTPSGVVFSFTLAVRVWVAAENRCKANEFIFSRSSISVVVAYHQDDKNSNVKLLLIKEFRSPVSNPEGFVYELPSGSADSPAGPAVVAMQELREESGLDIQSIDRLQFIGKRQLAATLSTHKAHVYALRLTDAELIQLERDELHDPTPPAVGSDEKTYVRVINAKDIFKSCADFSTLGMVLEALNTVGAVPEFEA